MRDLTKRPVARYRDLSDTTLAVHGSLGDANTGRFVVPFTATTILSVIAASGYGWDHVSVRVRGEPRCPTWAEMEHIKRLFFEPTETCVQLHPRLDRYINRSQGGKYVLHIWRRHGQDHELPPSEFM